MRLPAILAETAASNAAALPPAAVDAIAALADGIRHNAPLPPLAPSQPEAGWDEWGAGAAGVPPLDVPWFLLENYAYKALLDV